MKRDIRHGPNNMAVSIPMAILLILATGCGIFDPGGAKVVLDGRLQKLVIGGAIAFQGSIVNEGTKTAKDIRVFVKVKARLFDVPVTIEEQVEANVENTVLKFEEVSFFRTPTFDNVKANDELLEVDATIKWKD